MTVYNVYQITLTDSQVVSINANSEGDLAKTYFRLSNIWGDEGGLGTRVKEGIDMGLYNHAWIVEADSVDEVFEITNIRQEEAERVGRAKSGSVGDIVVDGLSTTGWLCISIGWVELPDDVIKYLQANVDTRVKMGKMIAGA